MNITGTAVRSLRRHLADVPSGADVVVAVAVANLTPERLLQVGFDSVPAPGDAVLPRSVGRRSQENAEGIEIIHRDRPMEIAYRETWWTWTERHGPHERENSGTRDVPYPRYPRTIEPPPSIELEVSQGDEGALLIAAPPLSHSPENEKALLFTVNLFLELFGECETLRPDKTPYRRLPTARRLNWVVLPSGVSPWPTVQAAIREMAAKMGPRTGPIAEWRSRVLTRDHVPDAVAIGRAGFQGYIVFLYKQPGLAVVESFEYGNATYIFDEAHWEELVHLTKAELIAGSLVKERIIHRRGWDKQIHLLLGPRRN